MEKSAGFCHPTRQYVFPFADIGNHVKIPVEIRLCERQRRPPYRLYSSSCSFHCHVIGHMSLFTGLQSAVVIVTILSSANM